MANENFFNLDALDQGISRELAEGMTTRVFPGDEAMISVVLSPTYHSPRSAAQPMRSAASRS